MNYETGCMCAHGRCCAEAGQLHQVFGKSLASPTIVESLEDLAPPGMKEFKGPAHCVVNDKGQVDQWCHKLTNVAASGQTIMGMDAEWNVSFIRGDPPGKVATLQIATLEECVIFHLKYLHTGFKLPKALNTLLANPTITFVGVNIKGDVRKLSKDYQGTTVAKFTDLRTLFNTRFVHERKNWSLQVCHQVCYMLCTNPSS